MPQASVRKERIEPLWDRVDSNRVELVLWEIFFLVSCVLSAWAMIALCLVLLFFFSFRDPALFETLLPNIRLLFVVSAAAAVLIGATWMGYALTRSEKWLLQRLDATLVPTGELLPTKYALKDMAIASGFEVAPAMYIMKTGNVNAFVFSHRTRRAVVGVTQGLAERMDVDEQRAVFANLMARLKSGDIKTATSITGLVRPIWGARDRDLSRGNDDVILSQDGDGLPLVTKNDLKDAAVGVSVGTGPSAFIPFMILAGVFVLVTEIILFRRRQTDQRRAEKADAEGMLLLKDPHSMLSALEKSVRCNNWVPNAGPAFAPLFYCWTGDDTDDENDPEWQRVTRLREVLGVEGLAPPVIKPNERVLLPPPAPRIEE